MTQKGQCRYINLYRGGSIVSCKMVMKAKNLRSVVDPVTQANERLSFEGDLRREGLFYCVSL